MSIGEKREVMGKVWIDDKPGQGQARPVPYTASRGDLWWEGSVVYQGDRKGLHPAGKSCYLATNPCSVVPQGDRKGLIPISIWCRCRLWCALG